MTAADSSEFPRGKAMPRQSPLFWVDQKDRYLRQLFIKDIEELTSRRLIIYFTNCNSSAQIDQNDDQYLIELLAATDGRPVDIMLETNGGYTDAAEKLVSILRGQLKDFRAIVPRRAKSNGTLLALAAKSIVMGPSSELGPIDPNLVLGPGTSAPAQFIIQAAQAVDPIILQAAHYAVMQTQKLASMLLQTGMMSGKDSKEIDEVVKSLSTRDVYHSHGSVIDAQEAARLGLAVEILGQNDEIWKRIWLLRCMYEYDAERAGFMKIFESAKISNSIRPISPNK